MQLCPNCLSSKVSSSMRDTDGADFGLPNAVIRNVEFLTCESCGEESTSLPLGAVVKQLREQLCELVRPLSGPEYAFLRRNLGATGRAFAEVVGQHNVSISRVENKDEVPAIHDALIRAVTLLDLERKGAGLAALADRTRDQVSVDAMPPMRVRVAPQQKWTIFSVFDGIAADTRPIFTAPQVVTEWPNPANEWNDLVPMQACR